MIMNTAAVYIGLSHGVLLLVLAADLWFAYSRLDKFEFLVEADLGRRVVGVALLLPGAIFWIGLKSARGTATVLGRNLFGAGVGGVLENSVLIGGTRILGVRALAL